MSEQNIFQRINKVMQDKQSAYVQKDATVTGAGSYKAVTHDNITATLRPLLVANGIVIGTTQLKGKIVQMRDPNAGIKMHFYRGDYLVSFINMDQPEDRHSVQVQAHSTDSGDKAPGKAMSMATKYAMLKTFSIETGENEEGRLYEAPLYTDEQLAVFHELVEQEKAYDFYLFIKTLPPESVNALNSSFPEGKITQGKKAVKLLESAGHNEFKEVVEDLQAQIAAQDPAALETTDEMSIIEKRFLMARLSDFEVNTLKKMKESAQ